MIFLDIFRTLRTDCHEKGENFEGLHNIFIDILAVYKDTCICLVCMSDLSDMQSKKFTENDPSHCLISMHCGLFGRSTI